MVYVLLTLALNLFHTAAWAAECDGKDTAGGEKMVEKINQRYDDFFRYQRHLEEREQARNKGRGENKALLEKHEQKLEKARLEYLKNRRPPPDRTDLELKAEEERKARNAKLEVARRCYVQQRDRAESLLKRGRMIPGDKEFDLDN